MALPGSRLGDQRAPLPILSIAIRASYVRAASVDFVHELRLVFWTDRIGHVCGKMSATDQTLDLLIAAQHSHTHTQAPHIQARAPITGAPEIAQV